METINQLVRLRDSLNPFELGKKIDRKFKLIRKLANKSKTIKAGFTNTVVGNQKKSNPQHLFGQKPWYSLGSL
ncbi:MAG TPA: hypothetical protein VJ044_02045, partial [Candidatus Hodarchaeales archaeon]|nr:hypothetical protein [Candidatus Hodarchaeales archaeon]